MSISLNNISKSFNGNKAIQDISCIFENGKTTVLIGPSGCGKSTLLRLIVSLLKPDKGTIAVEDELLSDSNLSSLRRKIGYVIQDGGLFPHLTAKENVSLMAAYIGWYKEWEDLTDLDIDSKFDYRDHEATKRGGLWSGDPYEGLKEYGYAP